MTNQYTIYRFCLHVLTTTSTPLQYEYTGIVRVLVNFLCVCKSTVNLLFLFYSLECDAELQVERFVVNNQLASLLSSQRRYYPVSVVTIRQRRYYSLSILARQFSLVIIGAFVSYRYVEITITNDN